MADNPYAAPTSNVTGGDTYGSSSNVATSTVNILRATKGWARFVSVLLFIAGAFMIIGAFTVGSQLSGLRGAGGVGTVVMLIYIVMGVVVYIIPGVLLGAYASRIGDLLLNPTAVTLDTALDKQRGFFKYLGIIGIIVISFFLISILIAIANS